MAFQNMQYPQLTPEQVSQFGMAMLPVAPVVQGAKAANPAVQSAIKILRGKITPADRELFGKFAQLVETNKARGNLGQTGQTIQSFIENAFGPQAANWNNKTVKSALDMLLQGIDRGK